MTDPIKNKNNVKIANYNIGNDLDFLLIAGPCVLESESLAIDTAFKLKEITQKLGINFVFKSSFDKANRTSINSFRGLGLEEGIKIFEKVKQQVKVPIITDVHEDTPVEELVGVVNVLQTPAFLCRQTNFITRVAKTGLPINIKKGQFLSPWDMVHVVNKAKATGNNNIMVCERGACFGYNNLVSDFRSLVVMKDTNCPVIYDATHSVQLPGGNNGVSGGQREFIEPLARAAMAVGVAGIFMETHPNPDKALSDGPNSWPLDKMEELLIKLKNIDLLIKQESRTKILDPIC